MGGSPNAYEFQDRKIIEPVGDGFCYHPLYLEESLFSYKQFRLQNTS